MDIFEKIISGLVEDTAARDWPDWLKAKIVHAGVVLAQIEIEHRDGLFTTQEGLGGNVPIGNGNKVSAHRALQMTPYLRERVRELVDDMMQRDEAQANHAALRIWRQHASRLSVEDRVHEISKSERDRRARLNRRGWNGQYA